MPLVRVDMIKGKSPEYKKTLFDCIHSGLVKSIGIEDWDRFQRIVEIPEEYVFTAFWYIAPETGIEIFGLSPADNRVDVFPYRLTNQDIIPFTQPMVDKSPNNSIWFFFKRHNKIQLQSAELNMKGIIQGESYVY